MQFKLRNIIKSSYYDISKFTRSHKKENIEIKTNIL